MPSCATSERPTMATKIWKHETTQLINGVLCDDYYTHRLAMYNYYEFGFYILRGTLQ